MSVLFFKYVVRFVFLQIFMCYIHVFIFMYWLSCEITAVKHISCDLQVIVYRRDVVELLEISTVAYSIEFDH
jgi:hypothetical protein